MFYAIRGYHSCVVKSCVFSEWKRIYERLRKVVFRSIWRGVVLLTNTKNVVDYHVKNRNSEWMLDIFLGNYRPDIMASNVCLKETIANPIAF